MLGYTGADGFGGCGLLDPQLNPKPVYYALQTLLQSFVDPGEDSLQRKNLAYSLSNIPALDHALFQKRDGTFELALWLETASWNIMTQSEISVSSQIVSVYLPFVPSEVNGMSIDNSGKPITITQTTLGNIISLPVDDRVTLLKFQTL